MVKKKEGKLSGVWYLLLIVALIGLVYLLNFYGIMVQFMGWFFVAVAVLKLIDLKGFAHAFSMYDIVAERSKFYAYIYPFIELGIGLAFLLNFYVIVFAALLFVVMLVGTYGVARNLLLPKPMRCACLGTKVHLPLTKFTLFEDITMAVMALMIMVQAA